MTEPAPLPNAAHQDAAHRSAAHREGWDDVTLWGEFERHAAAAPSALAVVDRDGQRSMSRGDLLADATALAVQFEADGLTRGDVISVQLPNRYETVVVALASLRLGLVINTVLPNYRARELKHIFGTAAPTAVAVPREYRGHDHVAMVESLRSVLPANCHVYVVDDADDFINSIRAVGGEGTVQSPPPGAAAWSELIFSSGTEATPKGVMHSEQTTNAGVRSVHEFLQLRTTDVVWMPSPVGHSTGFNFGLRFALYHGLALVLQDRWDPAIAIELVRAFGATYTLAATTFLQDLVRELTERDERLDGLSRFACGGAAVPPDLVQAAGERGIGVLRLYGSTEVLVATCNHPGLPSDVRLHTDGVPLPGVTIRTRADDGSLCAVGEPGEIEVQSWQNALGYFDEPERTADTFLDDNWVRSGDLGVIGTDGSLSIVGRKKEIIIRGGLNITPREIEELVLAFDEVERCAVIGLPDPRLGEKVCACVTLREGSELSFDEMIRRLRADQLATYKLPQSLHVVAELPATASGKIQKHVLRDQIAGSGSVGAQRCR
ncbi:MAG TPA: AMP-binding protein [Ilumatobacter sp.]|nr:AMP-binding protein [Ilumatobacter sp.]